MLSQKSLVIAFGLRFLHAGAQATLDASACLPDSGISTLPACNYLSSQISYCAGPQVATGAPLIACYCNQKLFNSFFDCESELHLCLDSDDDDGSLQTAIAEWHSACDIEITFSLTTPVVTSLTATYNDDFCSAAGSACASEADLISQCSLSHTTLGAQFSSCYCQPELLSLQYTCEYLLNTSCFGEPAALTDIPAYNFCDNAASVLGSAGPTNSLPAAASASGTSSLPPSTNSATSSGESNTFSITRPALPGSSSVNPGAQSTSSSTNSGDMVSGSMRNIGILLGAIAIWEAGFIIA